MPARADEWPADAARPPADGFVMVDVPAGCFDMGNAPGRGDANEHPVHRVCVQAFALGKFPVSQMEWISVMGRNPSANDACGGMCPVENISWNDARAFIQRLDARGDNKYRLPTEAEWEYAARAGGKTSVWSGTDDPTQLGAYAWYIENAKFQTHLLGQKRPNDFGLYEMTGNVWQWTSDWYDAAYYANAPRQDPAGPRSGQSHVLRGGYWGSPKAMLRVTRRIALPPDARGPGFGLRLVRISP